MKKTKYSAYFLLFICIIILIGLPVSCKDNNDNSSSNVVLLSFGPCPIPRGAVLRIIGKNLDQVQNVVLQGCDPVTNITKVNATEINITVPKTAENGQITLNAGNQAITSISPLTIEGEIDLTGFSPLTAKAGDVIKLEGEDLDFVQEVIFNAGVHVVKDSFINVSLTSIEVKVPLEAQTGKLAVSDGATTPIIAYFDDELNVILPTLESFSPDTIRAGDVLTITGKDLDLVKSVTFGGGVTAASFTENDTNTLITVTVPDNAQDGAVILNAFSDVKVSSPTDLIMVVPTITAITPTSVKPGDIVKITGTDLDLVSQVAFGGGKQPGDIQAGGTATEIQVKVPATAKDGTVVLTTLANKTVESSESITIQPVGGNVITIWEGSKVIGWGDALYIDPSNFENVPAGSILTLYFDQDSGNGWPQAQICQNSSGWPQYQFAELGNSGTINPSYFGTNTSIELVLTQAILDQISASNGIQIQGDGLTFTKITVTVPSSEKVIWAGSVGPIDWSGSNYCGPIDTSDLTAGQILGIDFICDPNASYWQMEAMAGSWWTDLENWAAINSGNNQPHFEQTDTNIELVITQTDIDNIKQEGSALLFAGNGIIITRLYVK